MPTDHPMPVSHPAPPDATDDGRLYRALLAAWLNLFESGALIPRRPLGFSAEEWIADTLGRTKIALSQLREGAKS